MSGRRRWHGMLVGDRMVVRRWQQCGKTEKDSLVYTFALFQRQQVEEGRWQWGQETATPTAHAQAHNHLPGRGEARPHARPRAAFRADGNIARAGRLGG
uniref:Uncharacterized protein n=1 Tax=Oryza sativa subsp. japonica TaxID=39947 RepID=Q6K847_ORYSJ|nr:hypothetical protein [Oryza sativa Japonica Group]